MPNWSRFSQLSGRWASSSCGTHCTTPSIGGDRARACAMSSARASPGYMRGSSFGRRRHTDAPADALVHPATIRTPIYSTSLQARLMIRPDHLSGWIESSAFSLPIYPTRAHPSAVSKGLRLKDHGRHHFGARSGVRSGALVAVERGRARRPRRDRRVRLCPVLFLAIGPPR